MNILSISQTKTQTSQSDFSQMLSAQKIDSEPAKVSFADFLRDARREVEKSGETVENSKSDRTDEKVYEQEPEKVARNEEKTESPKTDDKKEAPKEEKSEKLTQKKSSDDEKSEENLKNLARSDDAEEKFTVQNLSLIQNVKIDEETENTVSMEAGTIENYDMDDKTLSWLLTSSGIDDSEEISNKDFASLIDAAVEFIPGEASEEEKLESAQILAANDPQLFLETVSNAGLMETARGAVKSEMALDISKTASANESGEKKGGAKLSVHDLRTRHLFDETDAKIASDKVVQKAAEKKEINLSMQKQADGNMQMTMELASRAQENITSSSSQAAGATGSDFQAMLSNAVQDNAPEFVKAGNVILKDNNQGTINLILRPEGLGNVKISLNLDDKNLSAQITVQTKEAMDAFKESIPSLKQAFTESGFETGSFDLNFSNNQQNFAQGGNEGQNQQNAGLFAQKSYGEFVTPKTLASEAAEAYSGGDYSVNIVA